MPWGRQKHLSPEQVEEAKRLRNTPHPSPVTGRIYKKMDFRRIAKVMNVSEGAVRRALGAETANCGMLVNRETALVVQKKEPIPPHVIAERDRRLNEERSFSAVAFGDPPYSQSALGKRNGKTGKEAQNGATGEEWSVIARAGGGSKLDRQANAASQLQRILSRSVPDHSTG